MQLIIKNSFDTTQEVGGFFPLIFCTPPNVLGTSKMAWICVCSLKT